MQSLRNPMISSERDPITTHVLDSTTGRPAANIRATLTLIASEHEVNPTWAAHTSASDGRINQWDGPTSLQDLITKLAGQSAGTTTWSLRFDTGSYWGVGKTFYPEVEIKFAMQPGGGHYHVPLLLGPWGYTTYRGS